MQGGPWRNAYKGGFRSGQLGEEQCPHMCGSKDWEWWWIGWQDGIMSPDLEARERVKQFT